MLKATRQQTRDHNTHLVLQTIYNRGNISRADIARFTSLTRPTVSRIVADLIDECYVVETGQGPSAGGKRPTLLDIALDKHRLLAIDLGSREFRGAVVNLRGEIVNKIKLPTGDLRDQAALNLVYELLDALMSSVNVPVLGIGLGTPGLTNPQDGIVQEAVNLGWSNLPLGKLLHERIQVPVYVANDSHMAALGEFTFGLNRGVSNLIVIKIGQGIGAGIVLNGHPYYGDGCGAGEIGHVVVDEQGERCTCGNYGCLETTSSTRAILCQAQAAADRYPDSLLAEETPLSWQSLVSAMAADDEAARKVILEAGKFLGVAIANVIGTLNIQRIVIAGRVFQLGEMFLQSAKAEACRRALPAMVDQTSISYSNLGNNVVMLGSSAMVLKHELGVI